MGKGPELSRLGGTSEKDADGSAQWLLGFLGHSWSAAGIRVDKGQQVGPEQYLI